MRQLYRGFLGVFVGCSAFGAAIGGCGGGGAPPASEAVGTLRADLVTKGPNGDTFQIVGASLQLTPAGTDAGTTLQFDTTTTQTSDTFSVPAGTYTARLVGGPPWQLLDVTSGKTVEVNLLDSQPYSVAIVAAQTTSLTIHFELQGVGNVTFGTGSLATSISLADAAPDASAPTTGNFTLASGVSFLIPVGSSSPNAGIKSLMTASSPVLFTFANTTFKLGPWIPGVDTVCAAATLPSGYKPSSDILPDAGATGDIDLITEALAPGSTAQICLGDQNIVPGSSSVVEIIFQRTGAATTTSVKNALSGTTEVPTFAFYVIGTPVVPTGTPVPYNGSLAEFSDFASPFSMTVAATEIYFDPGAADAVAVGGEPGVAPVTTANSTLTFQLSP